MPEKMEPENKTQELVGQPSEKELATQPSVQSGQPSTEQGEVFTREMVDALIKEAKQSVQSAKDREIASLQRELAKLKTYETELSQARQQLAKIEADRLQAELDSAEGDPDLMAIIKQKHAYRAEIKNLEQRLADLNAEINERIEEFQAVNEARRLEFIKNLAEKHNISVEALSELGGDTPEELEANALKLTKILGVKPKVEVKSEQKSSLKPDSGVGFGVGFDLSKLTPRQKMALGFKQERERSR